MFLQCLNDITCTTFGDRMEGHSYRQTPNTALSALHLCAFVKEAMFSSALASLLVCEQEYTKTTRPIFTSTTEETVVFW